MKRLFLLAAIAGVFAFSDVCAQTVKGSRLGIGAEFAVPVGDLSNGVKFGYGGSLQFQTPIANKLNFTASAGYLRFKGKDYLTSYYPGTYSWEEGGSAGVIPVKIGVKYFVADNIYAGGEVGAAFATGEGSGTAFIYSPGVGIEFPFANKKSLDLGVRYESWNQDGALGFFGLRVAYNFGL
ncbi:hypothetical protein [Pedobacter sp. UYP1]|jgi:hypothetical protein|uniref:hypothetical protein n=1 Tax=Pedobacter sp. UYP1 TaxID=1756396 RepID=UPI00339AC20A